MNAVVVENLDYLRTLIAECTEQNDVPDDIAEYARQILDLKGAERTDELVRWFRSDAYIGAWMMIDGWFGALAREAWQTVKRILASDRPAMRWMRAGYAPGRAAIYRALKIDPNDPTAPYAAYPFRLIRDDEQAWVAGAVGCPRIWTRFSDLYAEFDITDVILWNPLTAELRILGDAGPATIAPCWHGHKRLTVYADGYAYFRAWAEARSERAAVRAISRSSGWANTVTEKPDGELPGVLIIGDVARAKVPTSVSVLEAGPGVDPALLTKAIYRQANLPRVQAHVQ